MHDDVEDQIRFMEFSRRKLPLTLLVLFYVALVLSLDTLASLNLREPIDGSLFRWGAQELRAICQPLAETLGLDRDAFGVFYLGAMAQFDWFKFIAWFLIPFLCSLPWMVWKAFTFQGWKKRDAALLLFFGGGGLLAMFAIPLFASLRDIYPELSALAPDDKSAYFWAQLLWTLSWLPGWEFMHRYFLLDRVSVTWPRFGWMLLPLLEGLYHLQKPGIKAVAMVFFSVFLTRWSVNRGNVLLPILAHFLIELDLILFMLFL